MKKSATLLCGAAAMFLAAPSAFAQHSYLPAVQKGKIFPLVDQDNGPDEDFKFDRVVTGSFGEDPIEGNIFRAGGPSAFTRAAGDPGFVSGFSALPGTQALHITNPVLDDPMFSASGNFLYWDGQGGGMPDFGAAPEHTAITIRRQAGDEFTVNVLLDGGDLPVGPWVEDVANPDGSRSSHFHLRYDVVGDDTAADNEAPDGIYLLGHITGMAGLESSDLIFIPLVKGDLTDPGLAAAFASTLSMLSEKAPVPEPAVGFILMAGAGLALIGRREKTTG